MAKIRAFSAFDMRGVIRPTHDQVFVYTASDSDVTGIGYITGDWQTNLEGVFDLPPNGSARGTITEISQSHGGRDVFEATGFTRSAATVLELAQEKDNDGLLACVLSGDDRILGSAKADYMIGFGGDDTLFGGRGNDQLFGGSGADTVDGGRGDDFLAGGLGADLLRGGGGGDTYLVDDARDRVEEAEGGGEDVILSYASFRIAANVEELVLIGDARINGRGSEAGERLEGNEARNRLEGLSGRDRLDGDGGADRLDGGAGRDQLTGGSGADIFRFASAAEADGDRILDFGEGADRLDLAAIDADSGRAGNQRLDFISGAAFSGRAGELAVHGARLVGDLDGDGRVDFAILLGTNDLGRGDLIL